MRILYSVLLFLLVIPSIKADEPEIRVYLPTQNPRAPIYVGKLQSHKAAWDTSYLSQLESILEYDLNYNGLSQVVPRSPDREQLLQITPIHRAFDALFWKKSGTPYVVKWTLSDKHIDVSLFAVNTGLIKHFNEIALTGQLHHDRRQIHKLADGITKTFFQKEGIANTRILYCYQVKNPKPDGSEWISEIWECDWDGANARQITHESSYCVTPVLMPSYASYSQERFLYVSYKLGQPKIYIASLKEGVGQRLISLKGNQLLPAVSPRRDKLAFISDAAGRTDLFLQPLNPKTGEGGTPIQLYSYPRATQASPTFSPDGSQLAFVSDKDGGMRIYTISATPNAQRTAVHLISKKNRENSCPCWSPDGKKLAYSAKTSGTRQIWIYDFETDEEWQLTSGEGHKENPSWAPDSQHLVFNSTNAASSELYIVNLNQPEALKISIGQGNKHYPTWGAR